jgi:alginate O-acetyltransferase complex protein AlgI
LNFSDPSFLFIFLPCSLAFFYITKKYTRTNKLLLCTLLISSVIFYAVNPILYILLFSASILLNFLFVKVMIYLNQNDYKKIRTFTLIFIICLNLSALIYFKFMLLDINPLTISRNLDSAGSIVLPLGISFYTFQQIALQVDCYWKKVTVINFLEYSSFISFFPQLIAGPIVFQKDMIPQFNSIIDRNLTNELFISGIFIFSIGLFKKAVFADSIANGVDEVYSQLLLNSSLPMFDAWIGLLAFPLQVYFDFSAYTDMACGIALLFGIRLSQNFNSPFKSISIIDFWVTWHITLMRFFRDYIFNPISISFTRITLINNYSKPLSFLLSLFIPVMFVFFLTGIWHGSGLNFILYGIFHGLAVSLNHMWRVFKLPKLNKTLSWFLTFFFVCIAFVLMRSDNYGQFNLYLNSLFFGEIYFPSSLALLENIFSYDLWILIKDNVNFSNNVIQIFNTSSYLSLSVLILILICKYAPNSNEIVNESILEKNNDKTINKKYTFDIKMKAFLTGILLATSCIALTFNSNNFIYFQF